MESRSALLNRAAATPSDDGVRRFQLLMEHSRDVLCELREGQIVYISPNCHTLSGHQPDYYIGGSPLDHIHPDDRAGLLRFLAPGWVGDILVNFRILDLEGVWRWREAVGTRALDSGGRPHTVMVLRDSDERHRAVEALQRSEARSRAQLTAIPDLMFLLDREGRYLDFKADRAEDLYVSADTLVGRYVRDTLPPQLGERVMTLIGEALADRQVHSTEYSLVKRGELKEYESRIMASGDDEVVVIARDVTEQKRSERHAALAREQTIVAEERERIARDLHDNVAQYFFGIGIAIKDLKERESVSRTMLRRKLGYMRRLSSEGTDEVRRAVRDLAPAPRTGDLRQAMEQLAHDVRAATRMHVDLDVTGPLESLDSGLQDDVFRAAREALSNAQKHGHASRAHLCVEVLEESVFGRVTDNGTGDAARIEHAVSLGRGYGLRSLREQFELRGGRLLINDNQPRGIIVSFSLPLPEPGS